MIAHRVESFARAEQLLELDDPSWLRPGGRQRSSPVCQRGEQPQRPQTDRRELNHETQRRRVTVKNLVVFSVAPALWSIHSVVAAATATARAPLRPYAELAEMVVGVHRPPDHAGSDIGRKRMNPVGELVAAMRGDTIQQLKKKARSASKSTGGCRRRLIEFRCRPQAWRRADEHTARSIS